MARRDETWMAEALAKRAQQGLLRKLGAHGQSLTDFSSNDYLGLARNPALVISANNILDRYAVENVSGSTGSRLLTGNCQLAEDVETAFAEYHGADAGLIFNSGYAANVGVLATLPTRHDTVLFDELAHASIREGIQLSGAKAHKFRHNDKEDLYKKIGVSKGRLFLVTEAIYSMDGDECAFADLAKVVAEKDIYWIVDEAHACGIAGDGGRGLGHAWRECTGLRILTFGKAYAGHGAVVLSSDVAKRFLINHCRNLIYTTALPGHSLAHLLAALHKMPELDAERAKVVKLKAQLTSKMPQRYRKGNSGGNGAIAVAMAPGIELAKQAALALQNNGMDVRPILHPSVPAGKERLRICLHSYNTEAEIDKLTAVLEEIHF